MKTKFFFNPFRAVCVLAGVLFLSFYLMGLREFTVWNQVTDYYLNPYSYKWKSFHTPRALLVYPAFYVSKVLGSSLDYVFTLEIICIISATLFIIKQNLNKIGKRDDEIFTLFFLSYLATAFFMNGRLAFAHLGIILLSLVYLSDYSIPKNCGLLLLASWLCSVSSGVFSIFFLGLLIVTFFYTNKSKKTAGLVIGLITSIYFVVGIYKNLEFYGFNAVSMLSHGAEAKHVLIFFLIGCLLAFAVKYVQSSQLSAFKFNYHLNRSEFFFYLLSGISVFLSIFGKSILFGALPVHFLAVATFAKKFPQAGNIQE